MGDKVIDAAEQEFVNALLDPAIYPHPCDPIKIIETHISRVILTGPFAYKIKKPVQLNFIDCSTLEKRRFFCSEELRLNRRLAPELYIDLVAIYGNSQQPSFIPRGDPFEFAVKMHQFSQTQLLSRLIQQDKLNSTHVDQMITKVAVFHQSIAVTDESSTLGSPAQVSQQTQDNFPFVETAIKDPARLALLHQLQQWSRQQFQQLEPILVQRQAQGFVRECHGDMHLGNMLLQENEVLVFDGIDFNERLRWTDVAAEVAFLAMDLEVRGKAEFSHRFINGYLEVTGDYQLLELLPFYLVYRAMVRAKVAAIRLAQNGLSVNEKAQLENECRQYLSLANQYSNQGKPQLIITHGLSGSGKSHGSQFLLEQSGAIRIRSDVERKRLHGLRALETSSDHPQLDMYSIEANTKTYQRLLELAEQVITAGYSVIIDAAFLRLAERQTFQQLATQLGVPFAICWFKADVETLKQRIVERNRSQQDASEADVSVLLKQLEFIEPLTIEEQRYLLNPSVTGSINHE